MIQKLISGGQTGADQGGLEAAEALGIPTGGKMPQGFKTEKGFDPNLAERFGLEELMSGEYAPRTRYNVSDSDGTVIFGNTDQPGSRSTKQMCKDSGKPYLIIEDFGGEESSRLFISFLDRYNIKTLNVAGNRESKLPGIQREVLLFLLATLGVPDECSEGS